MTDSQIGARAIICIPTYNERENITRIVPAVLAAAPGASVLIVDDNSPDGTGELADELSKNHAHVHVLHRSCKEGLGKAYIDAFSWAIRNAYEIVVEFDADFSHKPAYLPEMFELLTEADVVVGSRRIKGGGVENWGLFRRALSWSGSLYARVVLGVPVMDLTGGFNGFHRHVLETIDYRTIRSTGYAFQIEIKYRCIKHKLRLVEMPIIFRDRTRGQSKMNAGIMGEAMVQVIKLRLGLM